MSQKYKFSVQDGTYFVTSTVVGWTDVFTRDLYRKKLLESFSFAQKEMGLIINAWVLMTNHFHMICSAPGGNLGSIFRRIKSFTGRELVEEIRNNIQESRKEHLISILRNFRTKKSNYGSQYQFWRHENHPIYLSDVKMMWQKLNYIHLNPVRAGYVNLPEHWVYSSARDYMGEKGLLEIVHLF